MKRARTVAGNDNRPAAAATAEDVFLAWLLWLPEGADPRKAALTEIARIDRRGGVRGAADGLRSLFVQLVAAGGAGDPRPAGAGHAPVSPMDRSPPRP